jgi:hypothetical protein
MAAHILRTRRIGQRQSPFVLRRLAAFGAVSVAALLMQGCVAVPPQPVAGPDPSNAHSAVPRARYQPSITGTSDLRPATPREWREQNEGATPSRTP